MAISKRPMRRNSLIGPYGVGAIVPFPNNESLMIAGLDEWRYNDYRQFIIKEPRLTKLLGVSELRWPPDFREANADAVNCNLKIPAVRFPRWYYCPFCGQMKKAEYYQTQPKCDAIQWKDGRKCSNEGTFRRYMIPERFIVVCPEGHIDDFPIAEWVHEGSGHKYNPETCQIRRSTGGMSSNLTGVYYRCSCGAGKSMAGAMAKGALKRINYQCKASKPWLGQYGEENCTADVEDLKVVLKGATNVWFADTRSSISIPVNIANDNRKIINLVKQYFDIVSASKTNGMLNRDVIHAIACKEGVDTNDLYDAFEAREKNKLVSSSNNPVDENTSDEDYRFQEYEVLCKSSGSDGQDFHSINHPIEEYDSIIKEYFDSISLVPKLRETRAFVGFSRLEPVPKSACERRKELRIGNEDWLPAIEVYGEGIFFKFNSDTLNRWAQQEKVKQRISRLDSALHNSFFGKRVLGTLRAEFVLIHTFAHLIINQLSFDCGYGSSSIRERIYCEKSSDNLNMYGLLIYTASGDSEGSMGGLVRQGIHGRLENTIISAIKNAAWCTSDPVCIQSVGQGPESLNLAACHNCALLPETCCENGNRLLDRGMLVGTLDNPNIGYFAKLKNV